MKGGLISSPPSSPVVIPPRVLSKSSIKSCTVSQSRGSSSNITDHSALSWDLKSCNNKSVIHSRTRLRCNCSSSPGGPFGQGENDSKSVLDAFFLGKALAESINERLESAMGEILSAVGRLQADQQKQIQDFQVRSYATRLHLY
ncbi:OLC1v1008289C1 [Oldenlandia corymbosa var. corymbosa]|uniref:OLC1v1008289C1 n=1 Tax=Oldenlandia corymbosa var. corymbosa TaxID=529605 RepID=A0AAV1DLD8_OLDCO|nr:OLC1v1008289C1 [Oldenlandia corymbosa var. corymbosa]